MHFFNIPTSKNGPNMVCFVDFDFKICFAPQRHVLFRHRNLQKLSEPGKFCAFRLHNALRATTACTFPHLNFQKWSELDLVCRFLLQNVLRATTACNFPSLIWPAGSAPAALASLLFDPQEPQIIRKMQCFATCSVPRRSHLSCACIFFLLIFSLLTLVTSAFQLSILSEVSLLNFFRRILFCTHAGTATGTALSSSVFVRKGWDGIG